ncbi:MAG: hypothetical protein HRT54_02795 [Colwellia sp.]|nr:hypothetical protein [Colwellia sp.]
MVLKSIAGLSGVEIETSTPKKIKQSSPEFIAKTQERQIKQFKEWKLGYKKTWLYLRM